MATDARDLSAADPQPPANSVQASIDLDALALVARLNQPDGEAMIAALFPDQTQTLVDRLKEGADRHWSINPNRSLEMADIIIKIGQTRGDVKQRALGLMARGDALKLLGHSQEAWDTLEAAGNLFRNAGDEVGWARTIIGRLFLGVSLNRIDEVLTLGALAEKIFTNVGEIGLLTRLAINTARVYTLIGRHVQALERYRIALYNAESYDIPERRFLGVIYTNIGVVHADILGNLQTAQEFFERTFAFAISNNDVKHIALAELDLASIALERSEYSKALHLLFSARSRYESEHLELDVNNVNQVIIECYLALGRNTEAAEMCSQVIGMYRALSIKNEEARTWVFLANAKAGLNLFSEAKSAFLQAQEIYKSIGAEFWLALIRLRSGFMELMEGNINEANDIATFSQAYFTSTSHAIYHAMALALQAQVALFYENHQEAKAAAYGVYSIAVQTKTPLLRFKAHLLLGKVAEMQGDIPRAIRRYHAAVAIIERVQQGLTITLRTNFMEDKGEALKSLIALFLHLNHAANAFETLERSKSQSFFEYISNRQLLRWPQDDPECCDLITELDRLRDEHHWWYQKLHSEPKDDKALSMQVDREDALREVSLRERRMRAITEQLYLHSSTNAALNPNRAPRLPDIQAALDEDTLLVAYYHDSEAVWAFAVDDQRISAQALPTTAAKIERDINFLQLSIDRALTHGMVIPSEATAQAQRILKRLYNGLLAHLADRLPTFRRLIVVPYGHLHYLPFHLLHTDAGYLIETHEVVVEPAASYIVQRGPDRSGGARVIAHSWAGLLPSAPIEGRTVHDLFAGEIFQEEAANRQALAAPPSQILHIAAHAEYRLDQPDLSYIELADGQLRTDDLLQQDLSYELVTLSACETGRAYIAASDELIGLGRGFLYAGAGALVASLWRVADEVAQRVMITFYQALCAGESKAAALRHAQRAILAVQPDLHPAFWGAFQLVGDPRPLSHSEGEPL